MGILRSGAIGATLLAVHAAIGLNAVESSAQEAGLPEDLDFQIIQQSTFQTDRRSVDVRLNRPVEEAVLQTLARTIRDQAPGFDRTFIVYYLPGMEVDAGGWATTHFDPDLEVRVLGIPVDGGSPVDQLRRQHGDKLVGIWNNNSPGLSGTYAIFEEASGYGLTHIWPDGSSSSTSLVEKASSRGRKFVEVDNTAGEFYLITAGELQLHDSLGVIWEAQPVAGK